MRSFIVLLFVLFTTLIHSFRAPRIKNVSYRTNQFTIQMNNENRAINSITKHITKVITSGLVASSFLSVPMLVVSSSAMPAIAGFFQSGEQDAVDSISKYQKPVFELLDALRPADIPNAVGKIAYQITFFSLHSCLIPPFHICFLIVTMKVCMRAHKC